MNIDQSFPSPYVKASDLNGKPSLLTIRTCVLEELGQGSNKEKKPVLYFKEAQKGLVLNKTNATNIAKVYGDDTGNWTGKDIQVFPTTTEFKGETVYAIRVRVVPEAQPEKQPEPQPTAAPMADDPSDAIPF